MQFSLNFIRQYYVKLKGTDSIDFIFKNIYPWPKVGTPQVGPVDFATDYSVLV